MRFTWTPFALLVVLGSSGCAHGPRPEVSLAVPQAAEPGWRDTARPSDAAWIDGLSGEWQRVIAAVPGRARARLSAEGPLLDPAAAQDAPTLTPGSYRCRLLRLGGPRGVVSYKPDFCYIEHSENKLSFTKQTGSNLPGGWLFEDGGKRLVFLGTRRTPKAEIAPPYGEEASRDVAGVIERVAPFRWRMVLPRAGAAGQLDIYELTPVVGGSPGGAAR